MVSLKSVEIQLKRIKFNQHSWGRAEIKELPSILLEGEEIYECVNGQYEGGFALLVATNFRLLLVDKKPLKYLTVEDMRFDMINQIDYSHRAFGANISISAGAKNLQFKSFNQPRLRKLINHVQHCMAESKTKSSDSVKAQQQHLEQINQQLQAYLLVQHEQQEALRKQLELAIEGKKDVNLPSVAAIPAVKPDPALSDYLYAQGLLETYREQQNHSDSVTAASKPLDVTPAQQFTATPSQVQLSSQLYESAMSELYPTIKPQLQPATESQQPTGKAQQTSHGHELNALKIAYSKLPMLLRTRAFSRYSHRPSEMPPSSLNPSQPSFPAAV